MNLSDLKKQFDSLKAKEIKKTTSQDSSSKRSDPRIMDWKAGHTYKGRLIYWYPEGGQRKDPFIYQYKHSFYDAETRERGEIICPTSEYLLDRRGFEQCPVCKQINELYKDYDKEAGKWKTATSEQMYKRFKRNFSGYGLIYVVSDSFNEENNGHVRIMPFGDKIGQFLKKKIWGIEKVNGKLKTVSDEDSVIGFSAFDLDNGYNFVLSVSQNANNAKWNEYSPEFSRKTSSINTSIEELEKEIKALNFDKDFYRQSSPEEIKKFYSTFVLRQEVEEETNASNDEVTPIEETDDLVSTPVVEAPKKEVKAKTEKPVKKEVVKEEVKQTAKIEMTTGDSSNDFDLDDIDSILEKMNS